MGRIHRRLCGTWLGHLAVPILVALPLLAASTFSAPAAQTSVYLLLAQRSYYRIAFVSSREGNAEIYLMHADGSGQTNLTKNLSDDTNAVWSPDGSRIAFVSWRDGNDEIYVMHADGSDQTRLTGIPPSMGRRSGRPH
jgi:dipeptidyl aminopeptidase/acylaminoacyl peptidase